MVIFVKPIRKKRRITKKGFDNVSVKKMVNFSKNLGIARKSGKRLTRKREITNLRNRKEVLRQSLVNEKVVTMNMQMQFHMVSMKLNRLLGSSDINAIRRDERDIRRQRDIRIQNELKREIANPLVLNELTETCSDSDTDESTGGHTRRMRARRRRLKALEKDRTMIPSL